MTYCSKLFDLLSILGAFVFCNGGELVCVEVLTIINGSFGVEVFFGFLIVFGVFFRLLLFSFCVVVI